MGVTVPAKMALPFGLFDTVEMTGTVKGRGFFASEIHLSKRPEGLAKNMKALEEISRLALITRESFGELPEYNTIYQLFEKAVVYYAQTEAPPELITLKAFYKMLMSEGFPVKQDWLEALPKKERTKAEELLQSAMEAKVKKEEAEEAVMSLVSWAKRELGVFER